VTSAGLAPSIGRRGVRSALNLMSGVSLSIVPPAVLSISSNTFPVSEQGFVAVAVTSATFLSQLASGAVVESRLSSTSGRRFVAVPLWLTVLGVAAAAAVIAGFAAPLVVCIALPFLFGALEVGRSVSVAEGYAHREVGAAIALGIGAAAGVVAALLHQPWGLAPMGAGIAGAILIRAIRAPRSAEAPDAAIRWWVLADVALTGITYPVLNAVILALIGPAEATVFAAVSTVSGLLAIPLNFLRVRLLKEHSVLDIVVTSGALVLAGAVIAVAELTGLLDLAFGVTWTVAATGLPLVVACLWRVATLFSAIPFAALRRAGKARLVMILRGASAGFTFCLAVPSTLLGQIWIVFAALLVGELILAMNCEIARRRLGIAHSPADAEVAV
jgi:MFS family permease